MTKRERLLALGVGGLAAFIGVLYLVNSISEAIGGRAEQIAQKQADITRQNRTITFGKRARRELEARVPASLPSDRSYARSLYQGWLLNLAAQGVELAEVKVSPRFGVPVKRTNAPAGDNSPEHDLYFEHSFSVSGKGNLEQLVEFMYHFYQADFLHRIRRVDMKPMNESGQLNLSLTVDALSLSDAPATQPLNETLAARLARTDVAEYVEQIAYRNPFAPANKPPQLSGLDTQQGNPNREVSFQVRATDPENGEMTFSLAGEVPEGARINPDTGLFRWTPEENGTYELLVRVADRGLPAMTDETTVTIEVKDAVVVSTAAFDPATMAQVTGITETGVEPLLWVSVHTEGRVLKLRVGDTISVGTVSGTVTAIDTEGAKIETGDGKEIEVRLGKNLIESAASGG